MTAVAPPRVTELTEAGLGEVIAWGDDDARAGAIAELDRRDAQRRRAGRAREGQRNRHSEWETVARANFTAAEEYCRGDANMVNRAAAARGVTAWSLWRGAEDLARRDASQELLTFWDYVQRRPPPPMEYEKHARGSETGMDGYGEVNAAGSVNGEPAAVNAGAGGWRARHEMKTAENTAAFAGLRARAAAIAGAPAPPGGAVVRRDTQAVTTRDGGIIAGAVIRPPAAEPIDGALLWYLVRRYLSHYVAFTSSAELDLVTGWVFHACARDRDDTGMGQLIWRASPRLLITSRDRGAGKSTLLDLITILTLSKRGKIPKISAAKIARVLGRHFETVALDEAKTIFGSGAKSLELQGILLAGYTPRASYEVANESLPLFGAVAYAAKDELITETRGSQMGDLLQRSLKVTMRPAFMPEVDERAEIDGALLGRALVSWTDANRGGLQQASRDIADEDYQAALAADTGSPEGIPRAVQISRPLRACGRVIGEGAENDVSAAVAELTGGCAGAESADLMASLRDMAGRETSQPSEDEMPGRIVTSDGEGDWETPPL